MYDFARACKLVREGNAEEALAIFDALVKKSPADWQLRMQRALALDEAGQLHEARAQILECVAERPESAPARIILSRIEFDAGDFDAALEAAKAASELDPSNRLAKAYQGLALLAKGDIEEGYALLHGLAFLMSDSFQARMLLWCEKWLGERPDARSLEETVAEESLASTAAKRRMQSQPSRLRRFLWKLAARLRHPSGGLPAKAAEREAAAAWFLLRWQPERAQEEYLAALESRLDDSLIHERLIDARYELKDYGGVLAAAEMLGERAADAEVVALKVGAAKFWLGDYDGAIELLKRAAGSVIEFWPQYYLGLCELKRGNERAARQWFARATAQINPRVVEKRLDEVLRTTGEASSCPL